MNVGLENDAVLYSRHILFLNFRTTYLAVCALVDGVEPNVFGDVNI